MWLKPIFFHTWYRVIVDLRVHVGGAQNSCIARMSRVTLHHIPSQGMSPLHEGAARSLGHCIRSLAAYCSLLSVVKGRMQGEEWVQICPVVLK